jgi:hypothetical protein
MLSEFKIKVNHFNNWTHHQYGWKGAMSDLRKQINSVHKDSVLLEPCIEDTFITNYYRNIDRINLYRNNEWIGFSHHSLTDENIHLRLNKIIQMKIFSEAFQNLKGLFVLTNYQKKMLSSFPFFKNIPISVIRHPISFDFKKYNLDSMNYTGKLLPIPNGNLVSVDGHQRGYGVFSKIKSKYKKILLSSSIDKMSESDSKFLSRNRVWKITKRYNQDEYEDIITNNVHFVELKSPTASNYLLECISSNSPIFVNREPCIEEYLGKDYPLFYYDEDDVDFSKENILRGVEYLKTRNFKSLDVKTFGKRILRSKVYQSIK